MSKILQDPKVQAAIEKAQFKALKCYDREIQAMIKTAIASARALDKADRKAAVTALKSLLAQIKPTKAVANG